MSTPNLLNFEPNDYEYEIEIKSDDSLSNRVPDPSAPRLLPVRSPVSLPTPSNPTYLRCEK